MTSRTRGHLPLLPPPADFRAIRQPACRGPGPRSGRWENFRAGRRPHGARARGRPRAAKMAHPRGRARPPWPTLVRRRERAAARREATSLARRRRSRQRGRRRRAGGFPATRGPDTAAHPRSHRHLLPPTLRQRRLREVRVDDRLHELGNRRLLRRRRLARGGRRRRRGGPRLGPSGALQRDWGRGAGVWHCRHCPSWREDREKVGCKGDCAVCGVEATSVRDRCCWYARMGAREWLDTQAEGGQTWGRATVPI